MQSGRAAEWKRPLLEHWEDNFQPSVVENYLSLIRNTPDMEEKAAATKTLFRYIDQHNSCLRYPRFFDAVRAKCTHLLQRYPRLVSDTLVPFAETYFPAQS